MYDYRALLKGFFTTLVCQQCKCVYMYPHFIFTLVFDVQQQWNFIFILTWQESYIKRFFDCSRCIKTQISIFYLLFLKKGQKEVFFFATCTDKFAFLKICMLKDSKDSKKCHW